MKQSSRSDTVIWFRSTALAVSLLAVSGCKNVFIGLTLTTVTVSPSSPSLAVGKTRQMIALSPVSITATTSSLSSGQTAQFTATGVLENGNTVNLTHSVTWTSSNTAVATIDRSGLATARTVSRVGTTTIRAVSANTVSNTVTLTVSTAS